MHRKAVRVAIGLLVVLLVMVPVMLSGELEAEAYRGDLRFTATVVKIEPDQPLPESPIDISGDVEFWQKEVLPEGTDSARAPAFMLLPLDIYHFEPDDGIGAEMCVKGKDCTTAQLGATVSLFFSNPDSEATYTVTVRIDWVHELKGETVLSMTAVDLWQQYLNVELPDEEKPLTEEGSVLVDIVVKPLYFNELSVTALLEGGQAS